MRNPAQFVVFSKENLLLLFLYENIDNIAKNSQILKKKNTTNLQINAFQFHWQHFIDYFDTFYDTFHFHGLI